MFNFIKITCISHLFERRLNEDYRFLWDIYFCDSINSGLIVRISCLETFFPKMLNYVIKMLLSPLR